MGPCLFSLYCSALDRSTTAPSSFDHMFGLGPTSHGNGNFYDQGYGMKLLDFSVWGLFYKTFVICN